VNDWENLREQAESLGIIDLGVELLVAAAEKDADRLAAIDEAAEHSLAVRRHKLRLDREHDEQWARIAEWESRRVGELNDQHAVLKEWRENLQMVQEIQNAREEELYRREERARYANREHRPCACGCGVTITEPRVGQAYLNRTHARRGQRAVRINRELHG
jgi:hypothetical protein